MSLTEQLSLADVKDRLSEVIDNLEREHGRVIVTKHGRPAAVMLSVEDLESLEETLAILSNQPLKNLIDEGLAGIDQAEKLTKAEVLARLKR